MLTGFTHIIFKNAGVGEEVSVPMDSVHSFYREHLTYEPFKAVHGEGYKTWVEGRYCSHDEAKKIGYYDLTMIHNNGNVIWMPEVVEA